MASGEFRQILTDADGSRWTQTDSDDFRRIQINSDGFELFQMIQTKTRESGNICRRARQYASVRVQVI